MRRNVLLLCVLLMSCLAGSSQSRVYWRSATPDELSGFLPARAVVGKERIESELRTASGIVNQRGEMIASVLLITAGYAADGRFSYYLLAQHALTVGEVHLAPGAYVVGWTRTDDGLKVHIFDAVTLTPRGDTLARPNPQSRRVISFHIWPPDQGSRIQIGRYTLPYRVDE